MDQEVGFITGIRNFLIHANGFPSVKPEEMVVTESGSRGWVNRLMAGHIEVLMIDDSNLNIGSLLKKSPERLTVPVGVFLLGRAINPLGVPIDGKGPLEKTKSAERFEIIRPAKNLASRKFISEQFSTGITTIDTLIPIGEGQRQLLLGDPKSGKTAFLLDLIINQSKIGTNSPICIYAAIGKPITSIRNLIDMLRINQALSYTIVVATSATDTPPSIFLTPHCALSIAEYFQLQGKDVLVILDDMGNHAKIYREISLLSEQAPGRESYPGDIFYQQARLMERAGSFNNQAGGGSITLIPTIETNLDDLASFIPTNLMAMTDGHLLFSSQLASTGVRPAVDLSLSVSRVGRQTQNRLQNELAFRIRRLLSEAESLENLSRFATELSTNSQLLLKQKELIQEMLKQDSLTYLSNQLQAVFLSLVFSDFLIPNHLPEGVIRSGAQVKNANFIKAHRKSILDFLTNDSETKSLVQSVFKLNSLEQLIQALNQLTNRLEQLT